jgi:hypothetical protein
LILFANIPPLCYTHLDDKQEYIEGKRPMTAKEIDDYIEGLWCNRNLLPWEHCGKAFRNIIEPYILRDIVAECILRCVYKDEVFFFNIGIEEPEITQDMIQCGKWQVYTWAD